jgi:hypothetical protein
MPTSPECEDAAQIRRALIAENEGSCPATRAAPVSIAVAMQQQMRGNFFCSTSIFLQDSSDSLRDKRAAVKVWTASGAFSMPSNGVPLE